MRVLLVGPRAAAHAFDARRQGVPADAVIDVPAALNVLTLRRYSTVMLDPTVEHAEALAALLGPSLDGRAAPLLALMGPGLLLEVRALCKEAKVVMLPRTEERVLVRSWQGQGAAVGATSARAVR